MPDGQHVFPPASPLRPDGGFRRVPRWLGGKVTRPPRRHAVIQGRCDADERIPADQGALSWTTVTRRDRARPLKCARGRGLGNGAVASSIGVRTRPRLTEPKSLRPRTGIVADRAQARTCSWRPKVDRRSAPEVSTSVTPRSCSADYPIRRGPTGNLDRGVWVRFRRSLTVGAAQARVGVMAEPAEDRVGDVQAGLRAT